MIGLGGLGSRLAVSFVLTGALALAGASVYLDRALRNDMETRASRELVAKSEAMREILADLVSADEIVAQRQRFEEPLLGHDDVSVAILDSAGKPILLLKDRYQALVAFGRNDPAAAPPAALATATVNERPFRTITTRADARNGGRYAVLVALDMTEPRLIVDAFRQRMLNTMIVVCVLLGAAALVIVRVGLAPLRDMAARVRTITATRLSDRLPAARVPTELVVFAQSFNAALDRLEEAFGRLSQFSADLAHDLRTPIANLRGEAEVALARSRSPDEYREVLGSAIEEYERLNRMIEAMLFLARADNAQVAMKLERFEAAQEVHSIFEYFEALAETHGLTLRCEGSAQVMADRSLFRRALTNLLSNASAHANPHSIISVRLVPEPGGEVTVEVENQGKDIPESLRSRLFDRFVRGDASRAGSSARSGLGLAIVDSIMTLHGGSASLLPATPGTTRFALRFPPT